MISDDIRLYTGGCSKVMGKMFDEKSKITIYGFIDMIGIVLLEDYVLS